jgi:hypothetical protein
VPAKLADGGQLLACHNRLISLPRRASNNLGCENMTAASPTYPVDATEQSLKAFSELWKQLHRHLVQSDDLDKADLIFVLAGHRNRKVYGARLFRDAWAPRILMSTGNPPYIARVLEREVPTTALQSAEVWAQVRDTAGRPSPQRGQFLAGLDETHWSVEQIPAGWMGTLSEIKALARWLERRPWICSLLVVSAGMHLKRLEMCCRQLLPRHCKIRLVAVPSEAADCSALGGMPPREGPREILLECVKVILYRGVLALAERRKKTAIGPR